MPKEKDKDKDININEIISNLKNTDEFKRSKAIAGCITFLSNKINNLQKENKDLSNKISELMKKNSTEVESKYKLQSENKILKNESKLFQSKLTVTEELNKTLEQTIIELRNKINSDKIDYNKKFDQYSSSINKYKNLFNELQKEKQNNQNILNSIISDKNEINNEKDALILEIKKLKENQTQNNILSTKLKKYELLMFKMDLENQGYKDEIQKYQKQILALSGENINFLPLEKIDLNAELETIENNLKIAESNTVNNINMVNNNEENCEEEEEEEIDEGNKESNENNEDMKINVFTNSIRIKNDNKETKEIVNKEVNEDIKNENEKELKEDLNMRKLINKNDTIQISNSLIPNNKQ